MTGDCFCREILSMCKLFFYRLQKPIALAPKFTKQQPPHETSLAAKSFSTKLSGPLATREEFDFPFHVLCFPFHSRDLEQCNTIFVDSHAGRVGWIGSLRGLNHVDTRSLYVENNHTSKIIMSLNLNIC